MSLFFRRDALKKDKNEKDFSNLDEEDLAEEVVADPELYTEECQLRMWVYTVNNTVNSSEASVAYSNIEKKFEKFINSKTSKYFIKGGDSDDIRQEGRIGLHKAIRDFDTLRGMSFVGFACMCIERHLVSTIKRGLRNKVEILNESQSLDQKVYLGEGDDETALIDLICDDNALTPEDDIINKEHYAFLKKRLFDRLTVLERCVADQYLRGYSYRTIADNLEIDPKSVDNAISRVKIKAQDIEPDDM